ncbi:hypothetical protein BC938DRAFT_475971 [Jimgerdemannia flammicorona]|uniref:Uncharacterized protein n=1 Tax=Jimgerdemannia flammicorona TaxID=994334 RepID=A0A433PLI7_9FUNG|nr:hypothetical protein BC938DRAFT_475971 [Jimgerdemannia flammicorona]
MDDERQGSFFEWFADEGPDLGDIIRDDLFPEALRYYYMEVEDDETDDINAEFDLAILMTRRMVMKMRMMSHHRRRANSNRNGVI